MNNKKLSNECYKHFSNLEGNQHIAGLFGLEKILDIIEVNNPKRILEVGLGIGSISYTILKNAEQKNEKIVYDGTEANEFCLNALKENLSEYYESIDIYNNIKEINPSQKYDMIIIDGSDEALNQIKDLISPNGVIFIEGGRASQTNAMKSTFPKHRHTICISDYKNPDYGPFSKDIWSGGGQLIYIDPTFKQMVHFIKERVKTTFRYRIKRKF